MSGAAERHAERVRSRCYEMDGRFCYDAELSGYYMVPGEPGIFELGTDRRVSLVAGELTARDFPGFVRLIVCATSFEPGVLV